jgi:hypothetical protein
MVIDPPGGVVVPIRPVQAHCNPPIFRAKRLLSGLPCKLTFIRRSTGLKAYIRITLCRNLRTTPTTSNKMSSPCKITKFYYERAIPKNPRPVPEPDLVPGEFILDIFVRPGLSTPTGWDMYWMGNAKQLDLNSTPACLGQPSTRMGFYNIEDGMTGIVCTFCAQEFTTLDLVGNHM